MPASIELLPRKEFIITLENGSKIHGKFGTYSVRRLCLKKGYNDAQFAEAFLSNIIENLPEYLLYSAENFFRELKTKESFPYDEIDACSWIDEMGGILSNSETLNSLVQYAADSITGEKKTKLQKETA